jgi:hypothetical protein
MANQRGACAYLNTVSAAATTATTGGAAQRGRITRHETLGPEVVV